MPKTFNIDLVIFDCDGTLVNTEYLNNAALISLLKEHGIHKYDMDYALNHFAGNRFSKILEMVSEDTGHTFSEETSKKFLEKVNAQVPELLEFIDGAEDTVKTAAELAQVCVVSNGERKNVLYSIERAGLTSHFPDERVYTGLMAPNPKPAPDLFLRAASELGVKPKNILILEDSVAGVTGGVASGAEVWGFCGTHHNPKAHSQKLLDLGATKVFNDMKRVQSAIIERLSAN